MILKIIRMSNVPCRMSNLQLPMSKLTVFPSGSWFPKAVFLLMPLLTTCHWLCAQKDNAALIADVENKLMNHTVTISQVLTNKDYEQLHPETGFRELIKKYAATGTTDIAPANEPGKKIKIMVFLKDKNGQPLGGVVVYLYQTDARGWYAADAPHVLMNEGDRKHARLFGYVKTDKNGQFEIHTIKPSGYPQSDLPAHIHIEINGDTNGNKITELLFDDDERLKGTIRTNAEREGYFIAKPETSQAPYIQQFTYALKL